MRLRSLLFTLAIATGLQSNAQTWIPDTVTMGGGYIEDVYYSLKNGVVKSDSNTGWHLAFQMLPAVGPGSGVGIFANHAQGMVTVYSTHLPASTNFSSYTDADTSGNLTKALYNSDTSWSFGAFNQMRNVADLFDYSWGKYDMSSHNVYGDSLYVIKVGPAAFKVWIQEYRSAPADSIHYKFRIAQLNGGGDTTIKIYRAKSPNFTERVLAYYNVFTNNTIDHEPSRFTWDIVFTRYIEYISMGPGPLVPYPVTGVLSNDKVLVAEAKGVNPDTATLGSYPMSSKINVIGSDWKTFMPPAGPYLIDSTATYFIKSVNSSEYYQIKFISFTSSQGKTVFAKRFNSVTTVNDVKNNVSTYALVPNPASNDANLVVEAKEATKNARLLVTDMTGKVVLNSAVSLNQGMNAFSINTSGFAAGTYIVTLANGSWRITDKLTVQH